MRSVILLLILFYCGSFAPPESPAINKLRYIVKHNGEQVGEIRASRVIHGEQVIYEAETHMNIRVMLSQKVDYIVKAIHIKGLLQNSMAKSFVNDKPHHSCLTVWKGNRYEIIKDKHTNTLSHPVTYSGVMLYFREPASISNVYSEMAGQYNMIRRTGENQYILTDTKSKKQNKYWYKGGVLDRAFINHTLVDLEVQRVN